MLVPASRVRIYAPTQRQDGKRRPWRVRVLIDGKERGSRSFPDKKSATQHFGDLVAAKNNAERFDPITGLPVSMSLAKMTVAQLAHEYMRDELKRCEVATLISKVEVWARVLAILREHRSPRIDVLDAPRVSTTDGDAYVMGVQVTLDSITLE